MPTEKNAVGIWTVRMLTKLNNRVKKQSLIFSEFGEKTIREHILDEVQIQ